MSDRDPAKMPQQWRAWRCPACRERVNIHDGDSDDVDCACLSCGARFTAGQARGRKEAAEAITALERSAGEPPAVEMQAAFEGSPKSITVRTPATDGSVVVEAVDGLGRQAFIRVPREWRPAVGLAIVTGERERDGRRTSAETMLAASAIAKTAKISLVAALDAIEALEADGWKVARG